MKAVVCREYGSPDVLHLEEVPEPTPGDNDVLIKVQAASLNAYDLHMLRADPFLVRLAAGFFKPENEILGVDVAGRVEAVGNKVKRFRPGDEVYGDISDCGCGAYAEYVCAREDVLAHKPSTLTFEEAAAVPMAAVTALQGLRDKGGIQPGQEVLINGASGGVGTYAVQIAKSFDAEVTAVCSTRNLDQARSLGADHVIDYTREDFTENGKRFDLIFAANGDRSVFEYRRALNPGGAYVMAGGSTAQIFQSTLLGPWLSMFGSRKIRAVFARSSSEDLSVMNELLDTSKVVPVIDRGYPLSEVADAFRYLEEEHARGKVVITL